MRQEAGPDLKPDVGSVKPGVPRLGRRLLALAGRVPLGSTVADIGTDHGLLPAYLENNGLVRRAIGTDSSSGSLSSAARTRGRCGCNFDLRLGYGLEPLEPGEADVLVLAGLGGQTIAEVLSAGRAAVASAKLVIAQPMKDLPQFRRWAERSGFNTPAEDIIREGRRLYNILMLEGLDGFSPARWDASETGIEHEVGRALLANEPDVLLAYLHKRRRTRHAIAAARAGAEPLQAAVDLETMRRIDEHIRLIEQHT